MFTLTRSSACNSLARPRVGRLLVECLVALVLLAVCAQLLVALTRSVAWSTEQAQLTSSATSLVSQIVEADAATRCDSTNFGSTVGARQIERVHAEWTESALGVWRTRDVRIQLSPGPLAASVARIAGGTGVVALTLQSARSCR